ncbi:MAG TPA: hypothetical protein VJ995_07120 [Geothermobacteraceae bacterium]|nr:hypothetical protein [Geothermobacteraceae bacterium]
MRSGIRINGRYFSNRYDAGKYLLQLASQGQPVTIQQNERPILDDLIRGH